MQVTKYPIVALLLGSVLAGPGCESIDARIRQHEATYLGLASIDRQRLLAGEIRAGDNPEMVLIAYGEPTKRREITTSSGRRREVWTYSEKRLVKESAEIVETGNDRGRFAIEETYRTFNVVLREITFLDRIVVHVRDPQKEAELYAALER